MIYKLSTFYKNSLLNYTEVSTIPDAIVLIMTEVSTPLHQIIRTEEEHLRCVVQSHKAVHAAHRKLSISR